MYEVNYKYIVKTAFGNIEKKGFKNFILADYESLGSIKKYITQDLKSKGENVISVIIISILDSSF